MLGQACAWEGFKSSKDGKASWVQLPCKLLVTLVGHVANSYYEGMELEERWVCQHDLANVI